jgi:hypothetical protein
VFFIFGEEKGDLLGTMWTGLYGQQNLEKEHFWFLGMMDGVELRRVSSPFFFFLFPFFSRCLI